MEFRRNVARPDDFEAFVSALLREEFISEGKTVVAGPQADKALDMVVVEGARGLPGPTGIQIMSHLRIGLFMAGARVSEKGLNPIRSFILIVRKSGADEVHRFLSSVSRNMPTIPIEVLRRADIEALAAKYPSVAVTYRPELMEKAREAFIGIDRDSKNEGLIRTLRAAKERSGLAIFLGAGVSQSAGLPSWRDLLERLASSLNLGLGQSGEGDISVVDYLLEGSYFSSPLVMARFLRDSLDSKFADEVRRSLYWSSKGNPDSPLITEAADLSISGVPTVSFNFDDLLERNIIRRGGHVRPVFSEKDFPLRTSEVIYHVHGFLPSTGRLTEDHRSSLVLSEEAYHRQFTDPYSWQSVVQMNLLKQYVCLFVGFSMTDPDQRRQLDIIQFKQPGMWHYVILEDRWELRGIEISDQSVRKVLRGLKEASLRRLGLEVIWAKEKEEIPYILHSLSIGKDTTSLVAATRVTSVE